VALSAPSKKSLFTRGLSRLDLPVAHGEGKFVADTPETLQRIIDNDQVAFRYVLDDGAPAGSTYPQNPNGSVHDIAGIEDASGKVMGLMPHPERFALAVQHPQWRRQGLTGDGAGLEIFRNAVHAVK